jgi:tripartite-type tricarboxylate transporter receptor subunit TctC
MMAEIAHKAPSDGYTLVVAGSILWLAPFMQKVSYDPVQDFSPVAFVMSSPHVLVVYTALPVNSVKELIAMARGEAGKLNYASSGTGTSVHLAAELFKSMAGVSIVHVPYKGSGPAFTDLMGGQVQVMFAVAAAALPHIKSGRLKALAITSKESSAVAPNLPTVAASGLPGYEAVGAFGVLAPARTPEAIVNRLNQEIARALVSPDVREKVLNMGFDAVGGAPQVFATAIKTEMSVLGKVIRDAGIRGGD